MEISLMLEMN